MTNTQKRIALITGVFILIITTLLGGSWFARVPIGQAVATYALTSLGFKSVSLHVAKIDTQELLIEDIRLSNVIGIDRLVIRYQLADLLGGTVAEISADNLRVDISNPDNATFKQIQSLASPEPEKGAQKSVPVPQIHVRNFKIIERQSNRSVEIVGNAEMTSDQMASLSASLSVTLNVDGGDLTLGNGQILASGSIPDQTATFTLSDMRLKQGGDNPQFKPLDIQASGDISAEKSTFKLDVRTEAGLTLIETVGEFDAANQSGQVQYLVKDLVFKKETLQPGHLFAALANLPALTVSARSEGQLTVREGKVEFHSETQLSDLAVSDDGIALSAPSIQMTAQLSGDLTGKITDLKARLKAPKTAANAENHNVQILDSIVDIAGTDIDNLTASLNATVKSAAKNREFPDIQLTLLGGRAAARTKFSGTAKALSDKLNVQFVGEHDLALGSGFVKTDLLPLQLGAKGVTLRDISSYLREVKGEIAGKLHSTVSAAWAVDQKPEITIGATLSNGSFSEGQIQAKKTNLTLNTSAFQYPEAIFVNLTDLSMDLRIDGRVAVLSSSNLDLIVEPNLQKLKLQPGQIMIKPGEGAIVKPEVKLNLSASVDTQKADFAGSLSAALFGMFLKFEGDYKLQTQNGNVSVNVPNFPFDPEGITLADILQQPPEGISLSGGVGANLKLRLSGDGVNGNGLVQIKNLSVIQEGMRLEDLSGEIEVARLFPLETAPAQKLSAALLEAGIRINNPSLLFSVAQVKEQPVLKIDRMVMELFGGAAEIRDAEINPFAKNNKLEVILTRLSIPELVALGDLKDVEATGSLQGRIPLEFDGEKLIVSDAILESEGPGKLNVKSEAARQALSSGGSHTKLLFDILENFNYSELSLKINKPISGEDIVTLHTKGANPDVENNRPVVLNVNLSTNLDRIFNTVLEGYRLSEQALRATLKRRKQ